VLVRVAAPAADPLDLAVAVAGELQLKVAPLARAQGRQCAECVPGRELVLQRSLLRSVQAALGGRRELAEEGCAFAWLQFLANQPERGEHLFGWLRTVAIHEAWRLAGRDSRETALEEIAGALPGGEWEALVPGRVSLEWRR
jgi:hypothetical protein